MLYSQECNRNVIGPRYVLDSLPKVYNEVRERDTRVSSPNAPFFLNLRLCYFQALAENNGDMIGMGFFWKREQGNGKGGCLLQT